MFYGNERVLSYMEIESEITGLRLIEPASLVPVFWDVTFEIAGSALVADSSKHEIALAKVINWYEVAMRNVLVMPARAIVYPLVNQLENLIVMLPGEATDDILAQAIQYKMQAIAGPSLIIGRVKVKASDSPAAYYCHAGAKTGFPEKVSAYTGFESHFEKPWWKRPDSFTYEFLQLDNENPVDFIKMLADHVDPLDEIESLVAADLKVQQEVHDEDAEIIQVEK